MKENSVNVVVSAAQGMIELYLELGGASSMAEPLAFEVDHQGLLSLWSFFESVGPVPVKFMPELAVSSLTGLPQHVDAGEFVSTARLMSHLGWYSCYGGTC